jgi:integrase
MAKQKRKKTAYPGVRFREHPERKHGVNFDRYFFIRYTTVEDGKRREKEEGLGWASEGWTAGKASIQRAELKRSQKTGSGAATLKEKRDLAEKKRKERKAKAEKEAAENISFGDFFQETYWPIAQTSKKKESYRKEMEHFNKWINPAVGALPFKEISQIQVEKIKRNMQRAKRSPRTIEYVMATFRQVWNLAKEAKELKELNLGDSPSRKVKIHKPDNERQRYLTDEEAEALLSALKEKSEQVWQIAIVSLDSGARFSEIARLTWGCLNIEKGMITYADAKKAGGTKSRVVPMTVRLKDLFKSMPMGGHSDLVFPGANGERMGKISNTFPRAVESIGLNDGIDDPRMKVCFHTWRHSYASRLVQAGVGLYTVQRLLGHSISKMTERYSHLSNDTLAAAVERMEKATAAKAGKVIELKANDK